MEEQVVLLYLANTNKFYSFDKEDIKSFYRLFVDYLNATKPQILKEIKDSREFSDEFKKIVTKTFGEYFEIWKAQHEDYGTDL